MSASHPRIDNPRTRRRRLIIIRPIAVRHDVVPQPYARRELLLHEVDFVEEEDDGGVLEQPVRDNGLPEVHGVFLHSTSVPGND